MKYLNSGLHLKTITGRNVEIGTCSLVSLLDLKTKTIYSFADQTEKIKLNQFSGQLTWFYEIFTR